MDEKTNKESKFSFNYLIITEMPCFICWRDMPLVFETYIQDSKICYTAYKNDRDNEKLLPKHAEHPATKSVEINSPLGQEFLRKLQEIKLYSKKWTYDNIHIVDGYMCKIRYQETGKRSKRIVCINSFPKFCNELFDLIYSTFDVDPKIRAYVPEDDRALEED